MENKEKVFAALEAELDEIFASEHLSERRRAVESKSRKQKLDQKW